MDQLVYFYPDGHEKHAIEGHPERPERITSIVAALQTVGYWDPFRKLLPDDIPEEVLYAVHTPNHVENLEQISALGGSIDPDTYLTPESCELAHFSAGGAIAVARAVWDREAEKGFALCRPPGHHATRTRAMGFCLLNNIALAAEYLIQQRSAKRIAILDFDLHHGNGTQDIFYERSDVMFISTHQFSQYPFAFYPGTGSVYEVGTGEGNGFTVNLALPPTSGDQAFQAGMDEVILPVLDRFDPEMVLISVGMDPHWRDPLGNLLLSAGTMGWLVENLLNFTADRCDGRLGLVLEGGYDLIGGSASAVGVVAALLGESYVDPLGKAPQIETTAWMKSIQLVKKLHKLTAK